MAALTLGAVGYQRGQQHCPYAEKDDPWSSHSRICAWLAELPPGSRILDVGTAAGVFGRRLLQSGLVLNGIEPNPEWAASARAYYAELLCCPIEDAPPDFLTGYDAVVCGDVLEHLVAPEVTLRQLLSLQQPGCLFILSVPNVANIWVRLQLLFGRFEYAERGILDRTHLHFYTRRTLLRMLSEAGLHILQVEATPIPLNQVHPFFASRPAGRVLHRMLAFSTRLWPTLLGYQFVVKAVKPSCQEDRSAVAFEPR